MSGPPRSEWACLQTTVILFLSEQVLFALHHICLLHRSRLHILVDCHLFFIERLSWKLLPFQMNANMSSEAPIDANMPF